MGENMTRRQRYAEAVGRGCCDDDYCMSEARERVLALVNEELGVDAKGTTRAERLWGLVLEYRRELHLEEDKVENLSTTVEYDLIYQRRLEAKVARVEALHVKEYPTASDEVHGTNPECSCGRSWPCETRAALADESGMVVS